VSSSGRVAGVFAREAADPVVALPVKWIITRACIQGERGR